jgi:hypothetical protein
MLGTLFWHGIQRHSESLKYRRLMITQSILDMVTDKPILMVMGKFFQVTLETAVGEWEHKQERRKRRGVI